MIHQSYAAGGGGGDWSQALVLNCIGISSSEGPTVTTTLAKSKEPLRWRLGPVP